MIIATANEPCDYSWMKTLKDLEAGIDEINRNYPRPGIPPLQLDPLYGLNLNWTKTYNSSENAGVYVFLDDNRQVLYIGKASCGSCLGSRLGKYFGHDPRIKNAFYGQTKQIATIPVPTDHEFEAPAIEEFLIRKVNPPLNKVGRQLMNDLLSDQKPETK